MGLFGIADILHSVNRIGKAHVQGKSVGWRSLKLTKDASRRAVKPILRGTGIGPFFGVLSGTGSTIASFVLNIPMIGMWVRMLSPSNRDRRQSQIGCNAIGRLARV